MGISSARVVLLIASLSLCFELRSDATCSGLKKLAGPMDYIYGYALPQCTCRSEQSCGPKESPPPISSEADLCTGKDGSTRGGLVNVTITVSSCCGMDLTESDDLTVEVWQPNKNGVYTQRSKCAAVLKPDVHGKIRFSAPVPGAVSFGADSRDYNAPHTSHGPIILLIRSVQLGEKVSETTSVRLFYPEESISKVLTRASYELLNCGPGFDASNPRNQTECSFNVVVPCKGAEEDEKKMFVQFREEQMKIGNSKRRRPPSPGCPKLKNVKKDYQKASLSMIVELCKPDGKEQCGNQQLRDYVRIRQSFYLARPLRVLKDLHDLNAMQDYDDSLGVLLGFKSEKKLHEWAVILDHHEEMRCCHELQLGEKYLVMGVPLPTVAPNNRTLKVMRLWTESIIHTHDVISQLLNQ